MAVDYEAMLNGMTTIVSGGEPPDLKTKARQIPDTGDDVQKRDYSTEQCKEFAKKGWALPSLTCPIADAVDLKAAVQSFGPAGGNDQVKKHIIKRARALGAVDDLPEAWQMSKSATVEEREELTGIKRKSATVADVPDELKDHVDNPEAWADWTNLWGPLDADRLPSTVKSIGDLEGYTLPEAQAMLENIVYAQVRLNDELTQKAVDLSKLKSPREEQLEEDERERLEQESKMSETQKLQAKNDDKTVIVTKDGSNDPSLETPEQKLKKKHAQKQHDAYAMFPGVFCDPNNIDPDHDGDNDMSKGADTDDDFSGVIAKGGAKKLYETLVTKMTGGATPTDEQDAMLRSIVAHSIEEAAKQVGVTTKSVAELETPGTVEADKTSLAGDDKNGLVAKPELAPNAEVETLKAEIAEIRSELAKAKDDQLKRDQEIEEAQEQLEEHRKALTEERSLVTKARTDLEEKTKEVETQLQKRLPDPLTYRESIHDMNPRQTPEGYRSKAAYPQTTREYLDR